MVAWPNAAYPLPLADGGPHWERAAMGWTDVTAARFRPVSVTELGVDGVVTVQSIDDAADWRAVIGDEALVAFTLTTHRDGLLEDADVVLNRAHFVFAEPVERNAFSTRTILAHELGHVLGLGHSCGDDVTPSCFGLEPDDSRLLALMAAALPPGRQRTVGEDDRAGATALLGSAPQHMLGPWTVLESPMGLVIEIGEGPPISAVRGWRDGVSVPVTRVPKEGGEDIFVEGRAPVVLGVWGEGGQVTVIDAFLGPRGGGPDAGGDAGIDSAVSGEDGVDRPATGCCTSPTWNGVGDGFFVFGLLWTGWAGRRRWTRC